MTDKSDIVARLENRAETLAQTALNGRDTRLIKLLETAAKEIIALRASLQPATPTAGEPVADRLVDWVYLHATEGQQWPSTKTKSMLIARAMEGEPTQDHADGMKAAAPTATGGDAVAGDVQSIKSLNINATVKVKLTEIGTARWRGKHNVTRTELELPLWELMAEFGPSLHMGMSQMYFVDNEIEIC